MEKVALEKQAERWRAILLPELCGVRGRKERKGTSHPELSSNVAEGRRGEEGCGSEEGYGCEEGMEVKRGVDMKRVWK
jgi:hypothetical protein